MIPKDTKFAKKKLKYVMILYVKDAGGAAEQKAVLPVKIL